MEKIYKQKQERNRKIMRVNFTASCVATYRTHLDIPDKVYNNMNKEEIINYLNEHIGDVNVESDLEWVNDIEDGITDLDIISEEKEDELER